MAFLASIKKRTDLRAKGVAKEADDRDPTTVQDTPWIGELDPQRFTKLESGGKWMLFMLDNKFVPMWRKCQKLYRNGELEGVSNMKVSTGNDYHSSSCGIIILYCGPTDDEAQCKEIGQRILLQTGYTNVSKKMFYKTDLQTLKGGIGRHKYTLQIPQINFDNLQKKKASDDNKQNVLDSSNRPKPPKNLLAAINKKKKKKKKPFSTRVRTKDGKIFKETINEDGTISRELEGQEVIPRYLEQNDAKTKDLPSYVYSQSDKKWVKVAKDDEKKVDCNDEVKELTILSYNIWFADRQWQERQKKLISMMQKIDPDIFCFQEVTARFLSTFCENEYIQSTYELSDNKIANTVTPYGVFIGCNKKHKFSMKQLQISHLYSNMGRRLLTAEISVDKSESVWISTVHLESLLNKDVRIEQLKNIFREYLKEKTESLLMGDFNFGDFTGENDYISKEYLDCWKTFVQNKMKAVDSGSNVEDDGLDAYRKMVQMGVPQGAIMMKMKKGGVSEDIIKKYESTNALPDGGMYTKLKKEKGSTCGSSRYDRILLKSEKWKVQNFEIIGQPNMPSDHLGVVTKLSR